MTHAYTLAKAMDQAEWKFVRTIGHMFTKKMMLKAAPIGSLHLSLFLSRCEIVY